MRTSKKTLDDGRIRIDAVASAQETATVLERAAYALASYNNIATDLDADINEKVREQIGAAQYDAFVNTYVSNSLAPFAISDAKIEVIMEPQASSIVDPVKGEDFHFAVVVTPKPHFELSSYQPVEISLPKPADPEAMINDAVEEQLFMMAQEDMQINEVEGRGVKIGDEAILDMRAVDSNGKELNSLTANDVVYPVGQGLMPQEFDPHIIGMKPKETKTFEVTGPSFEEYDIDPTHYSEEAFNNAEAYAFDALENMDLDAPDDPDDKGEDNKTITVTVTVKKIQECFIPPIDDAWVAARYPEIGTEARLREILTEEATKRHAVEQEGLKAYHAVNALTKRLDATIPNDLFEYTMKELRREADERMKLAGITLQDYLSQEGVNEQQMQMNLMMEAHEMLRQGFALDALARHLKLTVDDADISETYRYMAPEYFEETREAFERAGRLYSIREAALRNKANQWLVETATINYT